MHGPPAEPGTGPLWSETGVSLISTHVPSAHVTLSPAQLLRQHGWPNIPMPTHIPAPDVATTHASFSQTLLTSSQKPPSQQFPPDSPQPFPVLKHAPNNSASNKRPGLHAIARSPHDLSRLKTSPWTNFVYPDHECSPHGQEALLDMFGDNTTVCETYSKLIHTICLNQPSESSSTPEHRESFTRDWCAVPRSVLLW